MRLAKPTGRAPLECDEERVESRTGRGRPAMPAGHHTGNAPPSFSAASPQEGDEERLESRQMEIFTIASVLVAPRLLGGAASFWLVGFASPTRLAALRELDLGFLFLLLWCFSVLASYLNWVPVYFLPPIGSSGFVERQSRPLTSTAVEAGIFKILPHENALGGSCMQPYIGLETEGLVGEYNRANLAIAPRGMGNIGSFLVCLAGSGVVLPRATFMLSLVFVLGRLMHQVGYSKGNGGYWRRIPGILLAGLPIWIMEGVLLITALSILGGPSV